MALPSPSPKQRTNIGFVFEVLEVTSNSTEAVLAGGQTHVIIPCIAGSLVDRYFILYEEQV
jgi:hypothetical protein